MGGGRRARRREQDSRRAGSQDWTRRAAVGRKETGRASLRRPARTQTEHRVIDEAAGALGHPALSCLRACLCPSCLSRVFLWPATLTRIPGPPPPGWDEDVETLSWTRATLSSTSTRPRPSPWGHRCVPLCPSPATLRRIFPGVGRPVVHTAPSRVESSRAESRQDETRRRRTPRTWIIVILLSSRPPPPPVDAVDLALVRSFLHLPTYIPASRKKDVRTEMSERRYPWKMESREDSRGRTRPR